MTIPTAEQQQQQQQQIKAEADEIKDSIIHKREHRVPITSSNTQAFIDYEIGSVLVYFVVAGLLLLGKFLKPNPVNNRE